MRHLHRLVGGLGLLVVLAACADQPTAPEGVAPDLALQPDAPVVPMDLGTLGGPSSFAYGVNDLGEVVGRAQTATGAWHAFVWRPGEGMTDLGALGGSVSYAMGLNEAGDVAGLARLASGRTHAVRWAPDGTPTDLGTLGGPNSSAGDINAAGEVAGNAHTPTGALHAVVWDAAGVPTDLGTLGGARSVAKDVNDLGQAAGWSDAIPGSYWTYHGFLWTPGAGMVDLGTLGGPTSSAEEVNNHGLVVGVSSTPDGAWHAFSWTAAGGMVDLDVSPPGVDSRAYGVNDVGQITGSADGLGFILDASGGVVRLGTLGGSGSAGSDISLFGDVAGYAQTLSGSWRAALWRPPPGLRLQWMAGMVTALADDGVLSQGEANALEAKLQAARRQMDRGQAGAAANQLGAFANAVAALVRSRRLAAEEAAPLLTWAERLADILRG